MKSTLIEEETGVTLFSKKPALVTSRLRGNKTF